MATAKKTAKKTVKKTAKKTSKKAVKKSPQKATKKSSAPAKSTAPLGPYTPVVRAGDWVIVSGQLGVVDGKIFSGDTLFVGNCGRIDLPGGSANELYHSLFDVLHSLDDNLVLYPGHDYGMAETSTIGNEKTTNPVMQKMNEDSFVDRMGG